MKPWSLQGIAVLVAVLVAASFGLSIMGAPPSNPVSSQVGNVTTTGDIYFTGSLYHGLLGVNVTDFLVYPQQPATYTIWEDSGTYYAKNETMVTSNTDADTLIQTILTAMTSGGSLTVLPGTYTLSASVTYTNTAKLHIIGYGATFIPSSNSFSMLRINQGTSMNNGGTIIEGLTFRNPSAKTDVIAIECYDTFNPTIKNVYIEHTKTGILLNNWSTWVESPKIENVVLNDTLNGIYFNVVGGTNSFGQISIRDVFIHVPAGALGAETYGIFLPNGASIYRGNLENIVMWLGGDYSTGWYCNGDFTDARIDMSFEALVGTPTSIYGVYIDGLATYGRQSSSNSSYSFTYNSRGTKFSDIIHGYNADASEVITSAVTAGHFYYSNGTELIGGGTGVDSLLITSPAADHSGSGLHSSKTVGENVTVGQVLYMKGDGKLWKADATDNSTCPAVAIASASITADSAGTVYYQGEFRDDSWSWTPGGVLYLSETAGDLTQTYPVGSGKQVQILGYAISATVIYFNPNLMIIELA